MRAADRIGLLGLAAGAAGLTCLLLTALLGPSAMQAPLPGDAGDPPYSLVAHPSPRFVIGLSAAGIVLAAAALGLCLYAMRRGWLPSAKPLLIVGAVAAAAFMLMPPVGSGDHLNYAAYGRMAVTGNDPYVTTADNMPRDPVAAAVESYRDTPTVYGPIATAEQTFASLIGGTSVRLTVFVMSVFNTGAFLGAGLLMWRAARRDRHRELRVALLWTANPLLLYELVGGAHNDVLAIALVVSGLVVFAGPELGERRTVWRILLAGVLIGFGAAVKINVAIVGAGPAWLLLRDRRWRGLAALFGGAAAVTGLAYLASGDHAFDQLGRAAKSVALSSPWHLFGHDALLFNVSRSTIQLLSYALTIVLAALLLRALPEQPAEPYRVAAALALAWLFAAPYALPWYDGLGWALLALIPMSRFDGLMVARTTMLALAYLPARDPRLLPRDLGWTVNVVRGQVTTWVLTSLLVVLVVAAVTRHRRAPWPGHRRPAPAESPH